MDSNKNTSANRTLEITHNLDEVVSDLDRLNAVVEEAKSLIAKIQATGIQVDIKDVTQERAQKQE